MIVNHPAGATSLSFEVIPDEAAAAARAAAAASRGSMAGQKRGTAMYVGELPIPFSSRSVGGALRSGWRCGGVRRGLLHGLAGQG